MHWSDLFVFEAIPSHAESLLHSTFLFVCFLELLNTKVGCEEDYFFLRKTFFSMLKSFKWRLCVRLKLAQSEGRCDQQTELVPTTNPPAPSHWEGERGRGMEKQNVMSSGDHVRCSMQSPRIMGPEI